MYWAVLCEFFYIVFRWLWKISYCLGVDENFIDIIKKLHGLVQFFGVQSIAGHLENIWFCTDMHTII